MSEKRNVPIEHKVNQNINHRMNNVIKVYACFALKKKNGQSRDPALQTCRYYTSVLIIKYFTYLLFIVYWE